MSRPETLRPANCGDEFDSKSLTVDQALTRIREVVRPISDSEVVALRGALWRIIATPVISPTDIPADTNSAMDGFAVRSEDLPHTDSVTLNVVGTAWAGRPLDITIGARECARVMTGAVLPIGADTVIMQEHCKRTGDRIVIGTGHSRGQFVRRAGEDLPRDAVVVAPGRRLTPAELGLLASLGIGEVRVVRRPRVVFFSTGDELRSLGEPLGAGEVHDSNRYTLYGMLTRLGVELIDMGVVRDDRSQTQDAFRRAGAMADAVVTSGGVSVGDADFVKETLEELGTVNFWKVAMKPGRPLAFGRLGNAVFFGLPGNPVSVMVTFYQFVLPALRRLMGEQNILPVRIKARLATPLRKRPGRLEYQRGILKPDANGELTVSSTGEQGSGILHSMSLANCFIVLPLESGDVKPDSLVDVEPFYGLV